MANQQVVENTPVRPPVSLADTEAQMRMELLQIQLDEARAKKAIEQAIKAQALKQRLDSVADMAKERASKLRAESECNHRMANNATAVGGQKISGGRWVLLCQHCQKVGGWEDFPSEVRPDQSRMGGPN